MQIILYIFSRYCHLQLFCTIFVGQKKPKLAEMKKAIVIGASSGIGREVAKLLIADGWRVGIAARRQELLLQLQTEHPDSVQVQAMDITTDDCTQLLDELIARTGGMDLCFLASGTGFQNRTLDCSKEIETATLNVLGFMRITTAAFNYMRHNGGGQIAVISSIAGTKGIGVSPAYSATKRFQSTYIDALEQLSHIENAGIRFTDIRPGFVDTPLLREHAYPMLMQTEYVARKVVDAVHKGKRRKVIDWRYATVVFFWRLIPQWLWCRLPITREQRK